MKKIIFPFLFLFSSFVVAQTKLSQTKFDLGKISRPNEDVMDLVLGNYGIEDLHLLRVEAPSPMTSRYTSKTIPKNSSATLRLKLNPKEKGKITQKVLLYFSNNSKPTEITIMAHVKSTPKNGRQDCPSFNSADMAKKRTNAYNQHRPVRIKYFQVIVGDSEGDNEQLAQQETNQRQEMPSIEEQRKAQGKMVSQRPNRRRTTKTERTRKTPEERRNSPSVLETLFGNNEEKKDTTNLEKPENPRIEKEEPLAKAEVEVEEIEEINPIDSIEPIAPKEQKVAKTKATKEEYLSSDYKANNIVFLIDASNSMTKEGRMDLLKEAMVKLLNPLRTIDYLSIVTYAGDARVLLYPTSGVEKDSIKATINNIIAEGSTQAAKGLDVALDVGLSNFIAGGNNQIILATDGDFDIGKYNSRLREKLEDAAAKGLTTSAVGIRCPRWTKKSLREIKQLGNGDFLQVNNKRQTQNVLNLVKSKAKGK